MKKIVSAAVALIALVACSSSSTSNDGVATTRDAGSTTADGGGTTVGVVPADLRDVERDGEGLVSTTFGNFPERTADWTRAASVLSLLEQVWVRGKAANPGMPAAQVKMIDDAIVALSAGIAAKDQAKAAYAANAVGLAVPELFDSFHPDAPIGVVRMDAMYRQLGLDAHFKHLDAVKKDVDSLKSDWASTKGPVGTRAPTCHRVGGTATVTGDIDASLTNVDVALPAGDVTTIEKESDNGALEIDTLELLFDCPADNVTPNHGLGAKCSSDADCDATQVSHRVGTRDGVRQDAPHLTGREAELRDEDDGADPARHVEADRLDLVAEDCRNDEPAKERRRGVVRMPFDPGGQPKEIGGRQRTAEECIAGQKPANRSGSARPEPSRQRDPVLHPNAPPGIGREIAVVLPKRRLQPFDEPVPGADRQLRRPLAFDLERVGSAALTTDLDLDAVQDIEGHAEAVVARPEVRRRGRNVDHDPAPVQLRQPRTAHRGISLLTSRARREPRRGWHLIR